MNIRIIHIVLFYFFTYSLNSQVILESDGLMGGNGRKTDFLFGDVTLLNNKSINILMDENHQNLLGKVMEEREVYMELYNGYSTENRNSKSDMVKFVLDPKNNFKIAKVAANKSAKNKIYRKGTVSIGRVKLPGNVQRLHFEVSEGIPININSCNNLQEIFIQDRILTDNLNYSSDPNMNRILSNNTCPGDIFLMDDLSNLPKLKYIHVYLSWLNASNAMNKFFISSDNFMSVESLRGIHLEDIPFFSVNFFELEKMEYLSLENIPGPELVNLSLVLYALGKDKSIGNWKYFLAHADTTNLPNLSKNGNFQTFYSNGQLLCEGSFLDGLPNGSWKFYYDNGDLCENRVYAHGEKTGDWIFMRPKNEYKPNLDTLLFQSYSNNKLIYMKEWDINGYTNCASPEHTFDSAINQEYYISYPSQTSILIDRNVVTLSLENGLGIRIGDTLETLVESWSFEPEGWSYSHISTCLGNGEMYKMETRGKPGSTAHYFFTEKTHFNLRKNINNNKTNKRVDTWLVDLENLVWVKRKYENDNLTGELIEIQKDSGGINMDFEQSKK